MNQQQRLMTALALALIVTAPPAHWLPQWMQWPRAIIVVCIAVYVLYMAFGSRKPDGKEGL